MIRCIAAILSALFVFATGANAQGFFRREGTNIVDDSGQPFLIRATGISGWLTPEAYMLGLNRVHNRHIGSYSSMQRQIWDIFGNESDAQAFWNLYNNNWLTEADIAGFAADGFNAIRLPFNYRMISAWETPGQYSSNGLQKLDQVIQWCKNQGLYVILDMHAAPGGQSHDGPADPEWTYWSWDGVSSNWYESGVAALWESNTDYFAFSGRTPEFNKQRTVDIWQMLAELYKDEPQILGYDLINEPFLPWGVHAADLRALLIRITDAVRAVDTNHMLIVEGNFFAGTFEGLVPSWDNNTALMFHKYWRPPMRSEIQQYIDAATSNNLPLIMGESGENSSAWFYEFKNLLEQNRIGWCWWGWKKVDMIAAGESARITSDYQYVIDNFRDNPTINLVRARSGLMQMADKVASTNCDYRPEFAASLLDPLFGSSSQPFAVMAIPGVVQAADYDLGNEGVAYHDLRSMNTNDWNGEAWNAGWAYRNDGVDIYANTDTDPRGIGFHVGYAGSGEWIRYTVNVLTSGTYRLSYRVASPGGSFQLYNGTTSLTSLISVPNTGGYGSWRMLTNSALVSLAAGTRVLELRPGGGVDFSWFRFFFRPADFIVNGALTGSGTQPNNWLNWNDGTHDPNTSTYRSSPNSWAFWLDGGIYQDITGNFEPGEFVTFGGYLLTPSSDALRSGSKYGVIRLEFYNGTSLLSTFSTPTITRYSAKDAWIKVESSAVIPANATKLRLVIRCGNYSSGKGRFLADDVYVK
ncbi:MAG: cellulase family glycosylhydrolase [Lentisphaerota bacterium]